MHGTPLTRRAAILVGVVFFAGRDLSELEAQDPVRSAVPTTAATQPTTFPSREAQPGTDTQPAEPEFDLDAFIAGLNPPTIEEVIASLEPIPTIEECLAPLPDDPELPYRQALTGETLAEVEALEHRIAAFCDKGEYSQALPLAEEIARIREHQQGHDHWQAADTRRQVARFKAASALSPAAQRNLADADRNAESWSALQRQGQFDAALTVLSRQLAARRHWIGPRDPTVASSLCHLAIVFNEMGRRRVAVALDCQALEMLREALGTEHPEVSTCMSNLSVDAWSLGDHVSSLKLLCRSLSIDRRLLGPEHPDWATGLNNAGMLFLTVGNLRAAESALAQALELRRKILPPADTKTISSVHNLAGLYKELGQYARAEALFRESLEMRRELYGSDHPEVATSLSNLASVLEDTGQLAEAERLQREALAIRRARLGPMHPDVAKSLHNLGNLMQALGNYTEAERLYGEAESIDQSRPAELAPASRARSLSARAMLRQNQGDYATAEFLFQEALLAARQTYGDEHPDVAAIMDNLAGVLRDRGDYASAESLYRTALALRQKTLGADHPEVAASLNNLAGLLHERGSLIEAADYYSATEEINRLRLGEEHPHVAVTLNNLATLREEQGDYTGAAELYGQSLTMKRRLLGDDHPSVAATLSNLAGLCCQQGDFVGAEMHCAEALQLLTKYLGELHPDVVGCLSRMASAQQARGEYDAAETTWTAAARSFEGARLRTGARGLELAMFGAHRSPLVPLAACQGRTGKSVPAWEHLEANLARGLIDALLGRQARPLEKAEQEREKDLLRRLSHLDERMLALLTKETDADVQALMTKLRTERDELQVALTRFELEMATKYGVAAGEVYELARIQEQLPADGALLAWVDIKGNPKAVDPNGEHWGCLVRHEGEPVWVKLAGTGADGAWTEDDDALPSRVAELLGQTISEPLHSALSTPQWPDDMTQRTGVSLGARRLRTSRTLTAERRDLLLSLSDSPHWGTAVNALYERSLALGDPAKAREMCRRLAAQRIDPLRPQLMGGSGASSVKHLIVLPAGWMAAVPVETIADEFTVSYAPSGTMYAWLKEKRHAGTELRPTEEGGRRRDEGARTLLALGDPVFAKPPEAPKASPEPPEHGVYLAAVQPDSNASRGGLKDSDVLLTYNDQRLASAAELGPAIQAAAESGTTRGEGGIAVTVWRDGQTLSVAVAPGKLGVQTSKEPASEVVRAKRQLDEVLDTTRGASFAPLPATRREVGAIASLFNTTALKDQEAAESQPTVLLGPDASEERLAELTSSGELVKFRYLHLATHGVMDDEVAMRSALILAQEPAAKEDEALERVLAGQEVYDGRLTAEQIVRTWKLDADLVTLSGCETALGKAAGGEGFLGFSQALFVAGARSLVLSLWKVDDTATALLMIRFYENLLGQRGDGEPALSKAEALREAKLWLRGLTAERVGVLCGEHDLAAPVALTRGEAGPIRAPATTSDHPFEHPYYWSAFILIGDPQ